MSEATQRPLEEVLFGAPPAPPPSAGGDLADMISAWYRASAGRSDAGTTPRTRKVPRPRPEPRRPE